MANKQRILLSCPMYTPPPRAGGTRPAPDAGTAPTTGHSLALLSESSVLREYQRAWEACRIATDVLPRAANVQTLVASWKTLWRWRRQRRMPERG